MQISATNQLTELYIINRNLNLQTSKAPLESQAQGTSLFTSAESPYRNRKHETSTAPTKAKSREPAYSQALNQNKIDRHGVKIQRVTSLCGELTLMNSGGA